MRSNVRMKLDNASAAFIRGYEAGQIKGEFKPDVESGTQDYQDYSTAYGYGRSLLPLSGEEVDRCIKKACACLAWTNHYDIEQGLTDDELTAFLQAHMSEGGSCGPGIISINYNGSGLRVWADWNNVHPRDKGTLVSAGAETRDRARRVFAVRNPDDYQLSLFGEV